MSTHFINLPPPPSDPVTPSEMGPGTPNSTTTSMSELSTIAIKDGHRGHLSHSHHHSHHHSPPSERTLDAERADRISRLAGLERVPRNTNNNPLSSSAAIPPQIAGPSNLTRGTPAPVPPAGYFDATSSSTSHNQPTMLSARDHPLHKDRSTVGSASATGSLGGGARTWASGTGSATSDRDTNDPDKMSTSVSEDMENASYAPHSGTASSAGDNADVMSDEGDASLVGFGEGASSTISGPTYTGKEAAGAGGRTPQMMGMRGGGEGGTAAKMIDGMTYDRGVVDTVARTPEVVGQHGRRAADAEPQD